MAGVCEGAIVECGKWTDPISLHLSLFYSEYSKSRMTLWKKMWGECNLIRDGGVVTYARQDFSVLVALLTFGGQIILCYVRLSSIPGFYLLDARSILTIVRTKNVSRDSLGVEGPEWYLNEKHWSIGFKQMFLGGGPARF